MILTPILTGRSCIITFFKISGVIGALFDLEAEKEGQKAELALGVNWTRLTAKALMYLVLTTTKINNGSASAHSGMDTNSHRSNSSADSR